MTKGGLARLRPTDRKAPLKRYVTFVAHSSGARCVLCRTLPPENDPLNAHVATIPNLPMLSRYFDAVAPEHVKSTAWTHAMEL